MESMDLIWRILSIVSPAAVVGALALWRLHRADGRSVLLKLNEQLASPDAQSGRRLLHQYAEQGLDWWDVSSPEASAARDKINGSLALFDMVGWYVHRRYVRADDILELWAPALVLCWHRAYEPYVKVRRESEGWPGWSHYERLVEKAEKHLQASRREAVLVKARSSSSPHEAT